MKPEALVILGEIRGPFGVRGWLRIRSFTRPREALLGYRSWTIRQELPSPSTSVHRLQQWQPERDGFAVQLDGITSRDDAFALRGATIAVPGSVLPPAAPGTYYWRELIGMQVLSADHVLLGTVTTLHETGSADVLEVLDESSGRKRLIPFVQGHFVLEVNRADRSMVVDWHPDD